MVKLHRLKPADGSNKERRRVGRGIGSGSGKTAGRGTKGQKARSGGNIPVWFEGGQTPLVRRIPKRGFNAYNRTEYDVVNVRDLAGFFEEGAEVTLEQLREAGLAGKRERVKILGDGELEVALHVQAHAFSKAARRKIEAAGGSAAVV